MRIFYLGSFPPPYGGVTIKNNAIYSNIKKHLECKVVNFNEIKKRNIKEFIKLNKVTFDRTATFIIGISGNINRRNLTKLLYYVNKTAMNRSIIMVMGGTAHLSIINDKNYSKWVKGYKMIYVETKEMKDVLIKGGINNVSVFPNCRQRPTHEIIAKQTNDDIIKCVYFSQISKEKGADVVLESSKIMNDRNIKYTIDFYGKIKNEYEKEFKDEVSNNNHISYKGVYKGDGVNVYELLNQYDVLLFPTRWKGEGVPGVLIESKIAALPSIASNHNFNSEIIDDGINGVILENNDSLHMADAIEDMYNNKDLLYNMKINAKNSAENYYFDNYIEDVLKVLTNDN